METQTNETYDPIRDHILSRRNSRLTKEPTDYEVLNYGDVKRTPNPKNSKTLPMASYDKLDWLIIKFAMTMLYYLVMAVMKYFLLRDRLQKFWKRVLFLKGNEN